MLLDPFSVGPTLDVYGRQILTSKVDPRNVKVKKCHANFSNKNYKHFMNKI